MNLEDIIDPEYGLQQDKWSLSKPKFGKDNQLTVVGWSGKCSTNIIYLLHCSECAKDTELFGEGYFKSLKSNLTKSQIPCGCALIAILRPRHNGGYSFIAMQSPSGVDL